MKNINMQTIKLLIDNELYELSQADKNTIYNAIYHLMDDIEISDIWEGYIKEQDKSLERYVFDGVIGFMKYKNYNADNLYNHEDDCEIFEFIHSI